MKMGIFKNALIIFLFSLTAFSVIKYLNSFAEKKKILSQLNQIDRQLAVLKAEKQDLLQELEKEKELKEEFSEDKAQLTIDLEASQQKAANLSVQLDQAQKESGQLNSQIATFMLENQELKQQNQQISQEIDDLKVKISSIQELKKAIRELKLSRRILKVSHDKVRVNKLREREDIVIEGNQGYLTKDGESTHQAKARIEVIPFSVK